jgi:hypothetical protein
LIIDYKGNKVIGPHKLITASRIKKKLKNKRKMLSPIKTAKKKP